MSVAISPSETTLPGYIRARGRLTAAFGPTPRGTRVRHLAEAGGYRLMFPNTGRCEAVILNTAGGTAGGDGLDVALDLAPRTDVTLTTQSAEKIYRAQTEPARVRIRLSLGEGAHLAWLPLESILFDQAGLDRRIEVELARDATLTLCEMMVFGRIAMGETPRALTLNDHWRFRRDGRLIHAEATRLAGDATAILAASALGHGARAIATLLRFADDAATLVDPLRAVFADHDGGAFDWGVSAWNGMIVVRMAGVDAGAIRQAMRAALAVIPGADPPRVWSC